MTVCVQVLCIVIILITSARCNDEQCDTYCPVCGENGICVKCPKWIWQILKSDQYRCSKCPENCVICNTVDFETENVYCLSCKVGYYLHLKENKNQCSKCPENCKTCNSHTFKTENLQCETCKDGFYLLSRNSTYTCTQCPANCETCLQHPHKPENLQCKMCMDGFYLHFKDNKYQCSECPVNCTKCKSHTSNPENVQCETCIHGFYLDMLDGNFACAKCQQECKTCNSDTYCLTCYNDYYLSKANCEKCPSGRWGQECNFSCVPCSECVSDVCTRECLTIYGTAFCQHPQSTCHKKCSTGFIGQQKSGVSTTLTANLITRAVLNTTHNSRQQTTIITTTIITKSNTTTSNYQRTEGIYTTLTTTPRQRAITGTTIEYPEQSQTTIPLKTTSISEKVTSVQTEAKTDDQAPPVLYIVIAVLVGLVLTAVIISIIFYITRRKRTHRRDQESSAQDSNNEEIIYAKPNKARKTDRQKDESNELDLLNKHHSSAPASEQGHEKSNRGCSDVTSHVTDTVLDQDGIILETCLDESETAVTEESSSTDDDTYYNVLSLQRNLVKIDKFEEYVKSKSTLDFYTEFEKFPKGLSRPHTHANKPENKVKCRYNGVYPYDTNRVHLQDTANDFINASYIDGYTRQKEYIANLGPTKETMADFVDFWAMIWQDNVEKIVMLTKLVEETKMKCEQYWPDIGDTVSYGDVIVTCQSDDVYTDYRFRTLSVKQGETTRRVYQAHFLSWPDKRVPETTDVLLTLRDKVRAVKSEMDGPLVVHCSAGVGRTGTYIALDMLLQQLTEEGAVDVFGCVIGIRGQRVAMVQTLEQYEFIHKVLLEKTKKILEIRKSTEIKEPTKM